jgi:K(+)-stimulated pyrophosphate-energized sodium pump
MIVEVRYLVPLAGLAGLAVAWLLFRAILREASGGERLVALAEKVQRGAMVFMRRELRVISAVGVALAVLLWLKDWQQSMAFVLGAGSSLVAAFVGMGTATRANLRTAVAASERGAAAALRVAFFGGGVMGLTVASMGLVGLGGLFLFFGRTSEDAQVLNGFAMGASLVALFLRVGGGIFTKAADVGADLVGKVEAGIPEDDPRNPGVIADNVGDNVGDVAGMGSDIYESYCASIVATVAIAATLSGAMQERLGGTSAELMVLPLLLAAVGLVCSLGGFGLVAVAGRSDAAGALRLGTLGASGLFLAAAYGLVWMAGLSVGVWLAVVCGAAAGIVIGLSTEYFTAGRPMRALARTAVTGSATLLIAGLALGMRSVAVPVASLAAAILGAYGAAGLYGVGLAAVGMLGTVGITMAIDAYGPVADNAGGLAEMGGLGEETRAITDELDSVGNTTAAIGKGFAIGAAGLAALALVTAYVELVMGVREGFVLRLDDPLLMVGLLVGGAIPFVAGAMTMDAVGRAAGKIIEEIRRQFREIPGLIDGEGEPDAERCVEIATDSALREMMWPAGLALGAPVAVGFLLGPEALGGLLLGALVSGVLLALMMANAGGAWDNAKKWVEAGELGGKGSEAHKACVVGDTVGDPFKDTSGPSMNILIKLMAIISLVIAPLI